MTYDNSTAMLIIVLNITIEESEDNKKHAENVLFQL